ncbi:MAG: amidohydrolase family protein [Pseudomonadales bacterium]|nr:amidohydrolase family protein [Pseudomonadales bacterium]
MSKWIFGAMLLALAAGANADVLIKNARVVTMTDDGTIDAGSVLVRGETIRAVGTDVEAGSTDVIDAAGQYVTPGFFNSGTPIGLGDVESSSVRTDQRVRGTDLGAGFPVALAFDRRSIEIPIQRLEGITRAIVRPSAGSEVFAGQSAIIRLSGDRGSIVNDSNAVFVLLGEDGRSLAGGSRAKALLDVIDALNETKEYLDNRRAYEKRNLRELNQSKLDLDALVPVVRGEKPLAVIANRASDIETIVTRLKPFDIRLIIVGGEEAWKVASLLADNKVPVVINPLRNLPLDFDRMGATLSNAARLEKAGVLYAFMTEELTSEFRSLSQGAGVAVANGLAWEKALAAITVNPARIWGIDDSYGKLAPGMDADLVVWDGDPLDVTSAPKRIMIAGRWIDLTTRQTLLRDRYSNLEGGDKPFGYR